MVNKLFVATKAFISYNGKVLLLRESNRYEDGANAGRFDVVGGRVKPGQRWDESLLREVREETGLDVSIGSPFAVDEWRPVVNGEQWQIVGIYFECEADSDEVVLSEDHEEFVWIEPEEHSEYKIIPNLASAFQKYLGR